MDWKKYIASDPAILGGKPHIVGTRLSVDFILALMANGWTVEQVLSNYPTLTKQGAPESSFCLCSGSSEG